MLWSNSTPGQGQSHPAVYGARMTVSLQWPVVRSVLEREQSPPAQDRCRHVANPPRCTMSLQEHVIETLPHVEGVLNYLKPSKEKPRTYTFERQAAPLIRPVNRRRFAFTTSGRPQPSSCLNERVLRLSGITAPSPTSRMRSSFAASTIRGLSDWSGG